MRCIAVTGVKGGVGKSTFSVLSSLKLAKRGKKVILFDADVECPNDHLLLNTRLGKPKGFTYSEYPKLIKSKCPKCGLCAKLCKEHAIFWVEGQYPIFIPELCNGCGACWRLCPFGAIKPVKKISGRYFINRINKKLYLVTGQSRTGIAETGPIVKEIKTKVLKLAKKIKADYIVIDTAPGMHCNVIHALIGCDKVYAVTEPTPLGAYDLNLCLSLLKKLNIGSEVVLNKCDVGDQKSIEKITKKFETKISTKIPYSEKMLKAYSERDLKRIVEKIKIF